MHFGVSLAVVILFVGLSFQKTYIEDLTITKEEKKILDEFKALVEDRLPHDYMRKEVYLFRWLRARQFSIPNAEVMLMNHLKWRKNNKMDTIFSEYWEDMEEEYPYWLEGRDNEGKPVLYLRVGQLNLRRAVVSGNRRRLNRYIDKGLEEACELVREMGAQYKNVSQGVLLLNVDGFNLVEHGCLSCIQILLRVIIQYESHHPGCADKIIVINVPQIAEFIIQPARAALSEETNRSLYIYGTNRKIWEEKLKQWFDISTLPPELGGSKLYKGMEDDYYYAF